MENAEKITITRSMLDNAMSQGMKRADIAATFGLSLNQVKKLMAQAGYQKRRASYINFYFVDDAVSGVATEPEQAESINY